MLGRVPCLDNLSELRRFGQQLGRISPSSGLPARAKPPGGLLTLPGAVPELKVAGSIPFAPRTFRNPATRSRDAYFVESIPRTEFTWTSTASMLDLTWVPLAFAFFTRSPMDSIPVIERSSFR